MPLKMNARCQSVRVSSLPQQGKWGHNAVSAAFKHDWFKSVRVNPGVTTHTFHYLFNTSNAEQNSEQKRLKRNAFIADIIIGINHDNQISTNIQEVIK